MVGAYLHWELKVNHGQPGWVAWIASLAACAALGALTHLLVMRKLRRASPLARLVATLGMLIVVESAVVLRYGARTTFVPSELPRTLVHLFGVTVTIEPFHPRRHRRRREPGALGDLPLHPVRAGRQRGRREPARRRHPRLSPDAVATANWALGSALAGMAAILIAPIVQLQVVTMTDLVLAAMAAALVAGFRSFPIALLAAWRSASGSPSSIRYVHDPGISATRCRSA